MKKDFNDKEDEQFDHTDQTGQMKELLSAIHMNGFVIETFILIKYKLELILTIYTSTAWLIKWMHIYYI